jgi:hypothetical protein
LLRWDLSRTGTRDWAQQGSARRLIGYASRFLAGFFSEPASARHHDPFQVGEMMEVIQEYVKHLKRT